jgi:hypothetical protein
LGFINPTLYAMDSAGTGFVDVTTGSNDIDNVGGYSAAVGYDEASGLGSPNGSAFIAGLCQQKIDPTKSSFVASTPNPAVRTSATLTAVLKNSASVAVTNAVVGVTATSTTGAIVINGDPTSSTAPGKASYSLNSDATGTASFTVTSDTAGPVVVTVTYAGETVGTTTLTFTTPKSSTTTPGRATIKSLSALPGGFKLVVAPPASNGGSAVTLYQYSINGGRTWLNISRVTRTATVANLSKSKTYVVVVRARNAKGDGASSPALRITTLA